MSSRPTTSERRPIWLPLILLGAAVFYAVFILRTSFRAAGATYFTLIDDAMVSMRYAQHLAQGAGLVWNVGEKPIEGFTNPGWMLVMAGLHAMQIPQGLVSAVMMGLAAGILLANGLIVFKICEALRPDGKYAPLIAAGITLFYFPLVFWSLRGMEVGLLALLVGLAVLVSIKLRDRGTWQLAVLLSVISAAAVVVRMDAVLQIGLIAAYALSLRAVSLPRRILPAVVVVLVAAGVLLWQKTYFGDFLPNTYYQKVVGASLADRVKNGLLAFNDYATRDTLMLVVVGLAGMLASQQLRRGEFVLLGSLFLVQCAYSISVGGDYAEPEVDAANRFITQGMPALIILFAITMDHLLEKVSASGDPLAGLQAGRQAAIAISIAIAALAVISGQPWVNWAIDNAPLLKADIRRVKIGLAIAGNTAPDATIAVHAAGNIPYYSGRRTIDLLGLNDPVVAKGPVTGPFYPGHDKWNYDYSIVQLGPDLIADNWTKLPDFMKGLATYQELENGMYLRRGTTLVNVQGLLDASP